MSHAPPLTELGTEPGEEVQMIVQCCVCEKVRKENQWFVTAKPVDPHETAVSHGYCPACADKAFGELYRRARKRENSQLTVTAA